MSDNGSAPAFSVPMFQAADGQMTTAGAYGPFEGLTKREWLAGKALQGILAYSANIPAAVVVESAVEYADALLVALERKPTP